MHPSLPVKNVRELVALAKARPGQITYASFGVGSYTHFVTEALDAATGVKMVHVPYKGSAPRVHGAAGGEVMASFDALQSTLQYACGRSACARWRSAHAQRAVARKS